MTKISPINGHLLIEPVKHEAFITTQKDLYEEIGIVLATPWDGQKDLGTVSPLTPVPFISERLPKKGDKVFFDAWLAAKYPKEGSADEYYWLVQIDDVRAVEYAEPSLSEQSMS